MGSCSKDDDDDQTQQQQQAAPQMEATIVELPQVMMESNDPGAQQATIYANMANSFAGFASMMVPPEKSISLKSTMGDPWVYTWEFSEGSDVYATTLTINETSTEYMWTMVINGTIGGMVLDNFMYMEASQMLDGSSGEFIMYDFEDQGAMMMVFWTTDSNGVYTVTFEVPNEMKIVMTSNPDGSGSVMMYEFYEVEYILEFQAEWDAAGHGEYWEYYEGELMDHGTW